MIAWQTFENVLQWLLHFPAGAGDASGRLVIGSPRQDRHEFFEPVDDAVGEMVGKVEHRRGQNGIPAYGVKIPPMLRAHSRPSAANSSKSISGPARSTMATPASRAGCRCSGRMGFAGVGRLLRSVATTSSRSGMIAPSTRNRHGSYSRAYSRGGGLGTRRTSRRRAISVGEVQIRTPRSASSSWSRSPTALVPETHRPEP